MVLRPASAGETDVRIDLVGQWPNLQPGNNPRIINVVGNVFNLLDICGKNQPQNMHPHSIQVLLNLMAITW